MHDTFRLNSNEKLNFTYKTTKNNNSNHIACSGCQYPLNKTDRKYNQIII